MPRFPKRKAASLQLLHNFRAYKIQLYDHFIFTLELITTSDLRRVTDFDSYAAQPLYTDFHPTITQTHSHRTIFNLPLPRCI
jgi:hypothetical protein